MRPLLMTAALSTVITASCATCAEQTKPRQANETASAQPAGEPDPKRPPLETAPPNVPEFKPAFAEQTRAPGIQTETPIEVTVIASGFEKPTGKLYIVTPEGQRSAPVAGLPKVDGRDQGGLLDVKLDPDFDDNGLIYWTYYEPREGGNGTAVGRARLAEGPRPDISEVQIIFRMMPTFDNGFHFGSRIAFAPDGTMFVTFGERSDARTRVQAQDLGSHYGKIVHINRDGTVPPGYPFADRPGARPEIWTYGHRNPQGIAFRPGTNQPYTAENGPWHSDEVTALTAGGNAGWDPRPNGGGRGDCHWFLTPPSS